MIPAREWLMEENRLIENCNAYDLQGEEIGPWSKIMESYSNEVSKEYQVKILMFHQTLVEKAKKSGDLHDLLRSVEYDDFFGITTQRMGEIV